MLKQLENRHRPDPNWWTWHVALRDGVIAAWSRSFFCWSWCTSNMIVVQVYVQWHLWSAYTSTITACRKWLSLTVEANHGTAIWRIGDPRTPIPSSQRLIRYVLCIRACKTNTEIRNKPHDRLGNLPPLDKKPDDSRAGCVPAVGIIPLECDPLHHEYVYTYRSQTN